ncbi:hypothetical protein LQ567_22065 [Niabella pedocola]|uniref:Lipoprotein n=1 Tax=Niabella pedocola TaxID=1752077 RepID=A0ABS8PWN6_9BACT|nr:hypothetical protein [Niabella pedocola]MCD2425486.1 hypothetical protein [Niabella pedocola]
MRTRICLFTIGVLTLAACNHHRVQPQPVADTPKALEDNSPSAKLISKRGDGDLVESLYGELAGTDAGLKQLETTLDALSQSKSDSTNLFHQFDAKNQSYYKAAGQHANIISDSLLKDKVRQLVADHLATYNAVTARHQELLKAIDAKTTKLEDLHAVLKIVKTLPVMEKYQKDNRPGTASLEGYSQKQDGAVGDLNKMVNQ